MKVLTRYSVLFAGMLALILVSVSCEEFQPVFTGKYKDPEPVQPVTMTPTHTIAELAAAYEGSPFVVGVDKFARQFLQEFLYPGRDRRNGDKDGQERSLQRLQAWADGICKMQ